jgi:ornithine carbamoyltransferase
VPVFNGLTDEFHPTQMLADVLTMTEHCAKPLHEIAYAYVGDGRNNMANSLLLVGAKLGMDVRIGAPKHLWPAGHVKLCEVRQGVGCRITLTDDRPRRSRASTSSTPTSGCRWASRSRAGASGSASCCRSRSTRN